MPAFNGPSHGNAVEPSSGGATAPAADVTAEPSMERKILEMEQAASADQAVAAAPRASLILDDSASPPIADELFAYGAVLAAASAHAGGEFGSQTTSVMARLASTWGGDIAAAVDIAGGAAAAWLPAEALAQLSDGARVAAAAAAEWLAPAAETVGSIIAPAAGVASYDIVHLGSPFALLADSVAAFVEESAAVQSAVAQAQPRGPWGLTFSVIAADLVVLSYVYRRKKARPRVRLAPLGAA